MREYTKIVSEALSKGLRVDSSLPQNADFLQESQGMVPTTFGFEEPEGIVDPFVESMAREFPYPQLFVGKEMTLLCFETAIYLVDTTLDPWQYYKISVYQDDSLVDIPAGGVWHFADNGKSWYLYNGECVLYYDVNITSTDDRVAFMYDKSTINTGTEYRGRNFVGGVYPNDMLPESFKFIVDNLDFPAKFVDDNNLNYVMWSSIGGGDFPLWLFEDDLANEGAVPVSDDYYERGLLDSKIIESLRSNQIGFMPMPSQCDIYNVKGLGKDIIVYTSGGIFRLSPQIAGDAPTFGLTKISEVAVKGRGFAGGNETAHVCISTKGYLYTVSNEGAKRIGYKEYFENFENCLISVDPDSNGFYITDGNKCYILESGLGESLDIVHSVSMFRGTPVGIVTPVVDEEDVPIKDITIVTHQFDFQARAKKTISGAAIAGTLNEGAQVAFDYRYSYNEEYRRTEFVTINKEGNAYLKVNGLDFRLVVRLKKGNNNSIDYVQVRYQPDDNRFIRGINVNPNNT